MNTMTEAQAAEKWCPFVRHSDQAGGSFNRGSYLDNPVNNPTAAELTAQTGRPCSWACNCIASMCMAWRWVDDGYDYKRYGYFNSTDPSPQGWERVPNDSYQIRRKRDTPRMGYCGLSEPRLSEVEINT